MAPPDTPTKPRAQPHYLGHRQRLRERLAADSRALADYELLELLLAQTLTRCDTKPLAKDLLARFGNLSGVLRAPQDQLTAVPGFGPALAAAWGLYAELFARLGEMPVRRREVLSDACIVAEAAKARFGAERCEEFWVALLDNKNRTLAWERISRGTVDQTVVFPREVLALALRHQASGLILVHNHPGGDPTPSREDLALTERIRRSAEELGLRVLDHLVVTDAGHYSFNEHGLL
ncbi:MAG: DNA repair protein RadC [Desulfovibrionaceae bacterium]